jgi:TrpR family trp operon transcriptional repressor
MDMYFDHLATALLNIRDKKTMKEFLKGILTPAELAEIPTRLVIVKLLKKGIPQHAIAKKLGVGIATVTRGSKELGKGRFQNVSPLSSWRPSAKGG